MSAILMIEGNLARGISPSGTPPDFLSLEAAEGVRAFHESLPEYRPTPLTALPVLARSLGLKNIYVKDESFRFGLNAFKALGSSYAVFRIMEKEREKNVPPEVRPEPPAFVTATDGNHGKGLAWAARRLGCRAEIFMPKGSQEIRARAIREINSTPVTITDLNYMDTVRMAHDYAKKNGYYLVQDTGFPGYEEIPNYVSQGYTTMAAEAAEQLEAAGCLRPSHVFLQAGVGSMAGAVLGYLAHYYGAGSNSKLPVTSIVEPREVACVFASAKAAMEGRTGPGETVAIPGNPETIMAGLNCGEVNPFVWPVLRDYASFCFSCPDWVTEEGMRRLARPLESDGAIISGESGAVGLGLLLSLCGDPIYGEYRKALRLDGDSEVLLFSTEGDTDPESYKRIIERA